MKNVPSVSFSFPARRLLLISGVAVAFLLGQAMGLAQKAATPIKPVIRPVNLAPLGVQVLMDNIPVAVESVVDDGQTIEVTLFREGNSNTTRALPGKMSLGKLTLTRPWSGNVDWYNWRNTTVSGNNFKRRTVSISYRPTAIRGNQFNFYACWPTKWAVSPFNAKGNSVPIETMELVYERMDVQ